MSVSSWRPVATRAAAACVGRVPRPCIGAAASPAAARQRVWAASCQQRGLSSVCGAQWSPAALRALTARNTSDAADATRAIGGTTPAWRRAMSVAAAAAADDVAAAAAAAAPLRAPAVAKHTVQSLVPTPEGAEGRAFAVVKLSGTQVKVTKGDVIATDKILGAEVGTSIDLGDVLLVGSRDKTVIGRPVVPDAKVVAFVEEQTLDKKVIVFKKKRRQGYKKTQGYRRPLTMLRVQEIVADGF